MRAFVLVVIGIAPVLFAGCEVPVGVVNPCVYAVVLDDNAGGSLYAGGGSVATDYNSTSDIGDGGRTNCLNGGGGSTVHLMVTYLDIRHHWHTVDRYEHVDRGQSDVPVHINTWAP